MILQRNFIYALLVVWILSFVGLFVPWGTIVNISSGLFSGATIGILTSLTQYSKFRQEYFAKLFIILRDYYKIFAVDEELLRKSITYFREHNWCEIKACENFKDFEELNSNFIRQYENCPQDIQHRDFVPLNPFDKKSSDLLRELNHEVWFARAELIKFHEELIDVAEYNVEDDKFDCLYSRTILYEALSSGTEWIYCYAESIAEKFRLRNTKEYSDWLSYADRTYDSVIENKDYLIIGDELDGDDEFELYES